MKAIIGTKPRIPEEIKQKAIEYVKTHSIYSTAKKFGLPYNTINFWVNPDYREYNKKKGQENKEKIREYSKKYNKKRRKCDPVHVEKRNEDAKQWQKNKRKTDENWRKKNAEQTKKYYHEHKHEKHMQESMLKSVRKRRAWKLKVNECYNGTDEKYTRELFNNACAECGSKKDTCIDHWKPLSKGFALTRENAVVLCRKCNSFKNNTMPQDHYPKEFVEMVEKKLNKQ